MIVDSTTAFALSQVLPLLLIALLVELRRTRLHLRGRSHRRNRVLVGIFLLIFALAETYFVLSTDADLFPLQPGDLVAAALIFGLLAGLFALSLVESRTDQSPLEITPPPQSEDGGSDPPRTRRETRRGAGMDG